MKTSFLYPGQYIVVNEPTLISTILGSCVGIAIYDSNTKVAGLCHYLLAEERDGEGQTPRYGSYAIPKMIDDMIKAGASISTMRAQVMGGASVVSALSKIGGGVGLNNIDIARRLLSQTKIKFIEKGIGGLEGRKIFFDTGKHSVEITPISKGISTAGIDSIIKKSVKVMIVDDSATARTIFSKALALNKNIDVVAQAIDPYDAREKIAKHQPDVITLDIEMPRMNGVDFLQKLMLHHPLPVIMVSSLGSSGSAAQRALELGAVEFVQKPSQFDPSALRKLGDELIPKVIAASNATVRKLSNKSKINNSSTTTTTATASRSEKIHCVCVGGSTSGARSLEAFILGLAQDSPPILVSMSTISPVVSEFVESVGKKSKVKLQVVDKDTFLVDGFVYLPTPGKHIVVEKSGTRYLARTVDAPPVFGQRPSFDKLLQSAMTNAPVAGVAGIILSGFGSDGCQSLLKLREGGGVTIVESPDSAGCPHLPSEAIEIGAAEHVETAENISDILMKIRNLHVV